MNPPTTIADLARVPRPPRATTSIHALAMATRERDRRLFFAAFAFAIAMLLLVPFAVLAADPLPARLAEIEGRLVAFPRATATELAQIAADEAPPGEALDRQVKTMYGQALVLSNRTTEALELADRMQAAGAGGNDPAWRASALLIRSEYESWAGNSAKAHELAAHAREVAAPFGRRVRAIRHGVRRRRHRPHDGARRGVAREPRGGPRTGGARAESLPAGLGLLPAFRARHDVAAGRPRVRQRARRLSPREGGGQRLRHGAREDGGVGGARGAQSAAPGARRAAGGARHRPRCRVARGRGVGGGEPRRRLPAPQGLPQGARARQGGAGPRARPRRHGHDVGRQAQHGPGVARDGSHRRRPPSGRRGRRRVRAHRRHRRDRRDAARVRHLPRAGGRLQVGARGVPSPAEAHRGARARRPREGGAGVAGQVRVRQAQARDRAPQPRARPAVGRAAQPRARAARVVVARRRLRAVVLRDRGALPQAPRDQSAARAEERRAVPAEQPRSVDRALQPAPLPGIHPRPADTDGPATRTGRERGAGAAADRHRPLQADQRPPRPRGGRRGADGGGAAAARHAPRRPT